MLFGSGKGSFLLFTSVNFENENFSVGFVGVEELRLLLWNVVSFWLFCTAFSLHYIFMKIHKKSLLSFARRQCATMNSRQTMSSSVISAMNELLYETETLLRWSSSFSWKWIHEKVSPWYIILIRSRSRLLLFLVGTSSLLFVLSLSTRTIQNNKTTTYFMSCTLIHNYSRESYLIINKIKCSCAGFNG